MTTSVVLVDEGEVEMAPVELTGQRPGSRQVWTGGGLLLTEPFELVSDLAAVGFHSQPANETFELLEAVALDLVVNGLPVVTPDRVEEVGVADVQPVTVSPRSEPGGVQGPGQMFQSL